MPYRFGFMLITALRFIPVFQLELEQVKNAQMAKGIEMEGLSPQTAEGSPVSSRTPGCISVKPGGFSDHFHGESRLWSLSHEKLC